MGLFSWLKKKNHKSSKPPVSMDIQEFVKSSLIGVMAGIRDAQNEFSQANSAFAPLICPAWGPPLSDISGGTKGHADKIHELEFDLAITITESSSAKANGAAKVEVIGVYAGELGCSADSSGEQGLVA